MSEQQIPGVPEGFSVARLDHVRHGEPYFDLGKQELMIWCDSQPSQSRYVVLERIAKPKEYEAAMVVPLSEPGAYNLRHAITCRVPWNEAEARKFAEEFPEQVTIREKGSAS